MKPVRVPLNNLAHLAGNPRMGDVDAIAESYSRFGQVKPIVARRTGDEVGIVIDGNHQLDAAKQLGWDSLEVIFVDMDEATAKAYSLAANRTSQLGTYDPELLLAMISDIDLTGTGYIEQDVTDLLHQLTPPDLDALANEIGNTQDVPDEYSLLLKVTRATLNRWKSAFIDPSLSDDEKLNRLLDQVT